MHNSCLWQTVYLRIRNDPCKFMNFNTCCVQGRSLTVSFCLLNLSLNLSFNWTLRSEKFIFNEFLSLSKNDHFCLRNIRSQITKFILSYRNKVFILVRFLIEFINFIYLFYFISFFFHHRLFSHLMHISNLRTEYWIH